MMCGLLAPLSAIVKVPVREPPAVGVKATWMVHDDWDGRGDVQLFVWEKSLPEIEMLEITTESAAVSWVTPSVFANVID